MGADPGTIAMLAAMVGGNTLSSIFAPQGQKLNSFDTQKARDMGIDPYGAMGDARTLINNVGRKMSDYADRPVTLGSSFVQGLPTFTGGGMAMPIGVVGRDPARRNPELLTSRAFGPGEGWSRTFDIPQRLRDNAPIPYDDERGASPNPGGLSSITSHQQPTEHQVNAGMPPTVARRRQGTNMMAMSPQSDDTGKAMAAIDMLMASMRTPGKSMLPGGGR